MRPGFHRLLPAAFLACVLAATAVYFAVNPPPPVPGRAKPAFRVGALTIDEPFVLAATPDADGAAAYMTIENSGGESDRLVSGTLEIANRAEIQEAEVHNGVTQVKPMPDGLEIPAAGSVTLRPGSFRITLLGLRRRLREGEHIGGELTFAKAGHVHVSYEVGTFATSPFSFSDEQGAAPRR